MKRIKYKKGFTLLELLIVIAIIGILAGILFVAINPAGKISTANATKIYQDFKNIEKAFILNSPDFNFRAIFPEENSFGLGSNPIIKNIIDDNQLNYIFNEFQLN